MNSVWYTEVVSDKMFECQQEMILPGLFQVDLTAF